MVRSVWSAGAAGGIGAGGTAGCCPNARPAQARVEARVLFQYERTIDASPFRSHAAGRRTTPVRPYHPLLSAGARRRINPSLRNVRGGGAVPAGGGGRGWGGLGGLGRWARRTTTSWKGDAEGRAAPWAGRSGARMLFNALQPPRGPVKRIRVP